MKDITELVAQLAALKSTQPTAAPGAAPPPEPPDFTRSLLTPVELRSLQKTPRPRLLPSCRC